MNERGGGRERVAWMDGWLRRAGPHSSTRRLPSAALLYRNQPLSAACFLLVTPQQRILARYSSLTHPISQSPLHFIYSTARPDCRPPLKNQKGIQQEQRQTALQKRLAQKKAEQEKLQQKQEADQRAREVRSSGSG
jgi:hypothetical protein